MEPMVAGLAICLAVVLGGVLVGTVTYRSGREQEREIARMLRRERLGGDPYGLPRKPVAERTT